MVLKLKEIATISTGVTLRARIKDLLPSGNVKAIQMSDLGKDNVVHLERAVRIEYPSPKPNQLVKRGDLIFRSRGQTNTAAIVREDIKEAVVAVLPLLRIRADVQKVVPEFLQWWINQSTSQNYLASRSKGTLLKMVGKGDLDNLEVKLPSLKRQCEIVEFFSLATEEQRLLEKIKHYKALYAQEILIHSLNSQ